MAINARVAIPADTWTQLTNANATAITFQVKTGPIEIAVAVGAVAPSDFDDAITYYEGQGELLVPLASLAPGIAGTRVYAYSAGQAGAVWVSHA